MVNSNFGSWQLAIGYWQRTFSIDLFFKSSKMKLYEKSRSFNKIGEVRKGNP